jgi:hypothetical protein
MIIRIIKLQAIPYQNLLEQELFMETEKKLSKEEVVSKIFELYEECKKFPEWNVTIDNILTAIGDENVIEFFTSVGDIYLSQQLREVVNKGIF